MPETQRTLKHEKREKLKHIMTRLLRSACFQSAVKNCMDIGNILIFISN